MGKVFSKYTERGSRSDTLMHWFQKIIKKSQLVGNDPAVEILTMVATGTKDVDAALSELTSNNIPVDYICDLLNALLQSGPRNPTALHALFNRVGCMNQVGIIPSPEVRNVTPEQNTGTEFGEE